MTINESKIDNEDFLKIGKQCIIRTVTMVYVGTIVAHDSSTIVLDKCAWIPSTSQWSKFCKGQDPSGMEPYPSLAYIMKGSIVDFSYPETNINIRLIDY